MRIIILEDAKAAAMFAADQVIQQLTTKPDSVLGLATGSTPISLYAELIARFDSKQISFSKCKTYNLDEYLGLSSNHPQSYHQFMNHHLFNHVDFKLGATHLLDGMAEDPLAECESYEKDIEASGGIDLQLLGIGRNGHIGFNEPSSSLTSRTRIKTLTPDTVNANRRFFEPDEFQPHLAMTMGIGTIMEAQQILLLAFGDSKAQAVRDAIDGPVAARCPASILQMHPRATLVLDRAAASELTDVAYYEYIEQENQRLLGKS